MSGRHVRMFAILALVSLAAFDGIRSGEAHHMVLRVNLEEMTAIADRVFIGRCLAVEESEEMIAQGVLPVTHYTFEVERAIKGRLPKQLVIKHVGHPARRALDKGSAAGPKTLFHGLNSYKVGERLVLFLNPDSPQSKATSPVGLYQGAFFISHMPSGQELVRNSINNLGLFTAPYTGAKLTAADARVVFPDRDQPVADVPGLTIQSESLVRKRGALPLNAFVELVEQVNIAHGGERGVIVGAGKGAIIQ